VKTVDVRVRATMTVDDLAAAFCELDDDAQARFFVEVARLFAEWPHGGRTQVLAIGGHLTTCQCSTEEARDFVRGLADVIGDAS
jgi:hypothetical protein